MQRGSVLQAIRKVLPKGSLLLALLITILAGRFTVVALEPWSGLSEEPKKGPRKSRRETTPAGDSAQPRQGTSPRTKTAPAQPARQARVMVGALLSVKHGTQRSEVYVNGELVGSTPFAGDLSCRQGEPVNIEIVPRRGPAIVRTPICHSGAIEVFE